MQGQALPGFRDFYPDELALKNHIFATWREVARRYGFQEYDGPPLEPLELYTDKSGEEIVQQLYAFEDKGGRKVALRPEMTPTLARMVGAHAQALKKPIRWFSIPQLFRYERQQRGRLREHFQLNMDILGEASPLADAELIAAALDIMRAFGLGPRDVQVRMSDRRVLRTLLLGRGVSEGQLGAAFAAIDKSERDPKDVLAGKLREWGLGKRETDAVFEIAALRGLDAVLTALGKGAGGEGAGEPLRQAVGALAAMGLGEFVAVDLTIVRGLAYYTGIVFELFDTGKSLRAVCGGGRYDGLLKALGGVDLPALGFGMGDVVLGELLKERGPADQASTKLDAFLIAVSGEDVMRAELADYSPVRGCMVIRPHGYRIWELMQDALDDMFKATGHQNAYFPLFIPMSFLAKEAEHVEGFAKEVALVTHTRLKATGKVGAQAVMPDPESALEEPLVVRPTSETIIYAMFAKWIQSYRDLPLLMNQWCNIVRWEFRTRLFLRTTEFLWQEGHTAHATEAEAEAEARQMLGVYRTFQEQWMAMPVLTGRKTESEKFAGALRTYALEALMQDNKALQAGTSHNLGQNFAKAFNVQYQTAAGGLEYVWNTSWGVSTRMIGGLVMTHSDDNGLVCPPKLAPVQVVIVPIWKSEEERGQVLGVGDKVKAELVKAGIRVELDSRDSLKPGAKYFEWEAKGVPLRLEIGPRDVAAGQVMTARRTGGKAPAPLDGLARTVAAALDEIQAGLFKAAKDRREAHSIRGGPKQQFIEVMKQPGGFAYGGFCGSPACEAEIKPQTGATGRVLPDPTFRSAEAPRTCMWCGKPSVAEAVWAQAY